MAKYRVLIMGLATCLVLGPSTTRAASYSIADIGVANRTAGEVAINDGVETLIGLEREEIDEQPPLIFNDASTAVNVREFFPNGAVLTESGQLYGTVPIDNGESLLRRYEDGTSDDIGTIPVADTRLIGINAGLDYIAVVDFPGNLYSIRGNLESNSFSVLTNLGGDVTFALDINDVGQIVGVSRTGSLANSGQSFEEAFLFDQSGIHGLGTLGGISSLARGINNFGTIVGESQVSVNGPVHAFVYDPVIGMRGIGMPGLNSSAEDINEAGLIGGTAERSPNVWRAALFDEINGVQFLDDLIPADSGWDWLFRVTDINDRGQIAGLGLISGEMHAFLLTPVPEPSALGLLVHCGLLLLAVARRRVRPSGYAKSSASRTA